MNQGIPVLRRAEAQAEAGPVMLMVRRANMRLSIAASRRRGAGAGAVVIHLAHQLFHAVERQFVADKGDEGDVQRRSIEIALEIEQEDFQQRCAIVEGRAAAKTRYAIE